ncbi:class I SAM-dependent methyltransferase [Ohtaekwangia koreensis]|uniref:Methyltransferase domain-containing protein n=1 Tax=Ohtaekwangia koreensis TaxID=688867 RepID=A0A1T5LPM6_9BACT|nr:class I SAM-dependent methyltransferase [Ohtaekwangia koreensis]SKC77498.1 hypothetical protein SAMN05660236_3594 [Ohtaekwangia koreensis]
METLSRKPFQGVLNIIRFNWHFYVFAVMIVFLFGVSLIFLPVHFHWITATFGILIITTTLLSLGVSYYIYDYSTIYSLNWLQDFRIGTGTRLININAGFDETSHILAKKYPSASLRVFDFYDPQKHTEVSIKRARKAYPAYPNTIQVDTSALPLEAGTADYILAIFAAHEIRDKQERVAFLKQVNESLNATGRVLILEHLRDLPNFIAYNIGFLHFYSKAEWKSDFASAGLVLTDEIAITPFLALFILSKNNGTTS